MSREIVFNGECVNDDSDMYVIAEIGHNHQGDLEQCKKLFRAAKDCGVNAVKLQKRDNRALFTKAKYDSLYDNPNSYGATYGEHREFLEFGHEEYKVLSDLAKELGMTFFSTPFDFKSADFLEEYNTPMYKIASGDLLNIPLMKYVANFGKPMIVSTGGGVLDDVRRAYDAIMPINSQLAILQCTSSYPARPDQLNFRVIESYRKEFPDIVIGYSGHDNGIVLPIVSFMLGARIVEKHFTLDRSLKGTDHSFSLAPTGMKNMVRDLQRARESLGTGEKGIDKGEIEPLTKMGKKLVAAKSLPEGHVLTANDIMIKSPGGGLPPYEFDNVVGKKLSCSLGMDEDILFENLQGNK
jgi:sialic acid synthase